MFKGRADCDKWSREGWGPVVVTIEITGIRNRTDFVALTHVEDVTQNVRPTDIWMEADGTFDAATGEVSSTLDDTTHLSSHHHDRSIT